MRALDSLKLQHNDMHASNILLRESAWEVVLIDPSEERTQLDDLKQLLSICGRALPKLLPCSWGRRVNPLDALELKIGTLVPDEGDLLSEMPPSKLFEWREKAERRANE